MPSRFRFPARALAFATAVAPLPVGAVGLGPIVQQSALGQSLRVVIPVIAAEGESVAAECFKFASAERDVDGIPQILFGRVNLERTSEGARLVVTSPRPVQDPALRLTLQAGCDTAVRREYTLLLDPPVIEVPAVAMETAPSIEAPAPPAAVEPARPRARRPAVASAPRGAGRRHAAESATTSPRQGPPKSRAGANVVAKRPPPRVADQPRLKLSSAPPSFGAKAAKASPQEVAAELEAETAVLRQRIVELTAMVERMQQDLKMTEAVERAAQERAAKEAQAAAAAQPAAMAIPAAAAQPAAARAPLPNGPLLPPATPWWEANWPMLAFILGLPLVMAAALLWKRRQDAAIAGRFTPPRVALHDAGPATATQGARAASGAAHGGALRNAPAGVTDNDLETLMHTGDTRPLPVSVPATESAHALAVSELSHVTEEANVYVALGHLDRAIDVLTQHVAQSPRSVPAAWLMLLGLLHSSGRRQDFRRRAEDFHLRCNVQAPLWESFTEAEASGAGLDAFPHVQSKLVALWRKPECRAYLERLLTDNREGRRIGFPIAAYADILLLLQLLEAQPPVDIDSDLARSGRLDMLPLVQSASTPFSN